MSDHGRPAARDTTTAELARSVKLDGPRCRNARRRLGFSRARLAQLARGEEPLSEATIKRAEAGQAVYLGTARRLAEVLNTPLQALLLVAAPAAAAPPRGLLPDGPAIAVLPFDADEDTQRHFADGLSEDLTIRLGHCFFPVIARGSSFRCRELAKDRRALHEQLSARYVVEGRVRRDGQRVRVAAELTDLEAGVQVWADLLETGGHGVFDLQDHLSGSIARAVGDTVFAREVAKVLRRDPTDLAAWELSLRGAWHLHSGTRDGNEAARVLLERALKQHALLPLAWYCLGLTYQREIVYQWTPTLEASLQRLVSCGIEFERRFPGDPWSHIISAYGHVYRGHRATAMSRLVAATELDPNSVASRSLYGQTLAMAREPDQGIEQLKLAIRLSPRDPELPSFYLALALCHFAAARYEEAICWAQQSLAVRPDSAFCHGTIGAAYAHLGDLAAARRAVELMARLGPSMSLRGYDASIASTHPEIAQRYLSGLKMAGFSLP